MAKTGMLKFLGFVEMGGFYEKCYGLHRTNVPQHDAEVFEVALAMKVDEFQMVDLEEEPRQDGIITVYENRIPRIFNYEHDKGTETRKSQIEERMAQYQSLEDPCLWTFPSEARMKRVLSLSPNDNHWGALYDQARIHPHAEGLWKNKEGDTATLPMSTTMSIRWS